MNSFTFAGINVQDNSKIYSSISVMNELDGSPVQIPVVIIQGSKTGPCAWVLAGIDGDEIESIIAAQKVVTEINPEDVKGTIVVILAANPLAVKNVSRISPIDGKCLNEVFPGNQEGTYTERVADLLFTNMTKIMQEEDIVLSLHGGGKFVRAAGLIEIHGTGDKIEERSMELAMMACNPDLSIIVRIEERTGTWVELYKGNLTRELYKSMSVAPLTIEAGGLGLMDERDIRGTFYAIMNVLRGVGMVNGQPKAPFNDVVITKENTRVFPKSRGFWLPNVKAGDQILKDTLIASVVDIYGKAQEELRAPYDGIVLYMRGYGVVDPLSSKLQDIYGSNIGKIFS